MKEHLRFLAKAADSIADGDLVDRCIRRGQKWSLLPVQVSNALASVHSVAKLASLCCILEKYAEYWAQYPTQQ